MSTVFEICPIPISFYLSYIKELSHPRNLGVLLTLFQPDGADCAHHITATTPGFKNLMTSLYYDIEITKVVVPLNITPNSWICFYSENIVRSVLFPKKLQYNLTSFSFNLKIINFNNFKLVKSKLNPLSKIINSWNHSGLSTYLNYYDRSRPVITWHFFENI